MQIDDKFMEEVGLAEMPEDEKRAFMEHAQEELEVRVGQSIGRDLTEAQLDEFEGITDDEEALAWLEANAPNFREKTIEAFTAFRDELIEERESILG